MNAKFRSSERLSYVEAVITALVCESRIVISIDAIERREYLHAMPFSQVAKEGVQYMW